MEVSKIDVKKEDALLKQFNDYPSSLVEFGNSFTKGLFKQGIVQGIKPEDLQKYFANPDEYQSILSDIIQYFYISNAEIHQYYEMIESLPKLDYHIETFAKNASTDKTTTLIKKTLHNIDHKGLTRDLLKQNRSHGNVVGMWIGDKNDVYPFVFSDLKYIKIAGRSYKSKWQAALDMSWFDTMSDLERKLIFEQLKGVVTKKDYDDYVKNIMDSRYKLLPIERTFVLVNGVLNRNQPYGTADGTSILFDIMHKKKLKDVEQTIANKIINAVAVFTLGETNKQGEKSRNYEDIPKPLRESIHASVKGALQTGVTEGISLVGIPNWSKLEFPDISSDALDGDKFNQTNSDILKGLGVSGVAMNGEGANYNSAKLNLELTYKRIGVSLEEIEMQVYQRLIDLIVPNNQKGNFYMYYEKEMPLTNKERVDYLFKLNDKGGSIKYPIESLGVNFESYLEQTLYETEQLKLQTRLIPYATSFTTNGDGINSEDNGRPSVDDNSTESENTVRTRDSQGS